MTALRPSLQELARHHGILPTYWDLSGTERLTADDTREALLAAMGIDASDERRADAALADEREARERRLLAPARVVRPSAARFHRLAAHGRGDVAWDLQVRLEDGQEIVASGTSRPHGGILRARLPAPLPLGYHLLRVSLRGPAARGEAFQRLIVTPGSCLRLPEVIGARRAWGLWSNLYTIRGASRLGLGSMTDVERLGRWTAAHGSSFVGINPLHAVDHATGEASPYRPRTRLFPSPLYLDLDRVPEARSGEPVAAMERSSPWLRAGSLVDYAAAMKVLEGAMEAHYGTFVASGTAERREAFRQFQKDGGELLARYATFLAIEERRRQRGDWEPWRAWPAELRDPGSPAVAAAAEELAAAVTRHAFILFELDRQMGDVARALRDGGQRLGIYGDLALGSAPEGFDTWAFRGLFAEGASLGAPPDPFAAQGQDWGIPPLVPDRLAEGGYAFWTSLLRANLRHCGMLRIDHVMGLLRQFWVPQGLGPAHGAYVRFPVDDLLGILALESRRAGCVIVGEDLGTVPEGFRPLMARWGLLSSQVLYFERQADGALRPPGRFRRRSLATLGTHDLPPLAGYVAGRDIELRHAAGDYAEPSALASARSVRQHDATRLLRSLGIEAGAEPGRAVRAAHAFLSRTRATLVGVSLDDLAGEDEPVNLPGIPSTRHPSWSRKMSRPLEAVLADGTDLVEPLRARSLGPSEGDPKIVADTP